MGQVRIRYAGPDIRMLWDGTRAAPGYEFDGTLELLAELQAQNPDWWQDASAAAPKRSTGREIEKD